MITLNVCYLPVGMLKRCSVFQYFWIYSFNMEAHDRWVLQQISTFDLPKNPQKISIIKAGKAEDVCAALHVL